MRISTEWIPIFFDNFTGHFGDEVDALRLVASVCKDWRAVLFHPSWLYAWIAKHQRFGHLWDYIVSNPDLMREIARKFPVNAMTRGCGDMALRLTSNRQIYEMRERGYLETLWVIAVEWRARQIWSDGAFADNRPDVHTLTMLLEEASRRGRTEYLTRACDLLNSFDANSAKRIAKRVLELSLDEDSREDVVQHLLAVFPEANHLWPWVRRRRVDLEGATRTTP